MNDRKSFALCILTEGTNPKPYFKPQLFECPTWTLKGGERVRVETSTGTREATVIAVLDYADERMENFLNAFNEGRKVKRVLSVITEKELEYDE